MPSWVGFVWPPKPTPSRPASLAELERVLAEEHDAIARFYADKPEPLLGHLSLWDPAIGRLSLVQVLRVGLHHDHHHDHHHDRAVNDPYRICFVWTPAGPSDVEILDDH